MSETSEAIGTAFKHTVKEKPKLVKPAARTFLKNLEETSKEIGFPVDEQFGQSIAFALLNHEAPINQRRASMGSAINTARDSLLKQVLPVIGVDGHGVAEKAQAISNQFAANIVEAAEMYPKKPEKKDLLQDTLKILNPHQPSPEEKAVAASVVFDFFQPYLTDRLLELDLYDPEKLKEQMHVMKKDASHLKKFFRSTSHAVELAAEGQTSIPMEELIDRMFDVGPIFAKLVQGLNLQKFLAKKIPEKDKANYVAQISKGMQEGIHLPNTQQQQAIADELPEGLTYQGIVSSASIAHVVKTETPSGEERATKIKRPNIDQAIADNQDTFNLLSNIYSKFMEEHIKGTKKGESGKRVMDVFPFVLNTFVADLRQELDFPQEVAAQKRGGKMLRHHQGVHVPEIDNEFTDDEHITMEYVEGLRLENLPANVDHLKNLFVIALESWKSRFLHGDMHGGNVKGKDDGSLALYDWGKSVELTNNFTINLGRLLYAIARKNPNAIAKAYVRIQSPGHNQVTVDEARTVAQEVLDSLPENTDKELKNTDQKQSRWKQRKKAFSRSASGTLTGLAVTMGVRHQNIMDTGYSTALQTAIRYGSVVASELAKPEYQNKKFRRRALRQSIAGAIKEVYFSKPKENSE